MRDDALGEALVAAVPEMAGILEDHCRDYGRVRPAELFGDALRLSAYEWSNGRASTSAQVMAFMDDVLAGDDDRARSCVVAGILDPIASAGPSPALDAFVADWPERLRRELDVRRSARRQLADGVWIESPVDTELIEVLWLTSDAIEAVGSDGVAVYIVGEAVQAVDVADGELRWRYEGHEDSALEASGGVTITSLPDERLQVFAPFEYLLQLDTATGAELSWQKADEATEVPVASPLPAFPLRDFSISIDDRTMQVHASDGVHLATLTVSEPNYDPAPPMQIDDLLVLTLASGHVLGIRSK